MKRYKLLERIGFRYIVNHSTKEIHRVKDESTSCGIRHIKNGRYTTKLYALFLIKFFGYNGCCHCFKNKDTDKKHY